VAAREAAALSGRDAELEAARQAEAQLAAIVRSSDDAMVSMTPDLVITTWNPGAERLYGYTMAEMVGRQSSLIPGELREEFDLTLQQVRAGRAGTYETRRRRNDGSLVDVAVTLSAMLDADGTLIGYSSVSRDITSRLQADAKLAAARAHSEVVDDRDRIARDLSNQVVKRMFAAGLTLQSLAAQVGRPELAARIEAVSGELDAAIAEIRKVIFQLSSQAPARGAVGIRGQILDLAASMAETLGFAPDVTFSGQVDEAATGEIAGHLLAVAREALTTAAQYAHASVVELSVTAGGDLVLVVSDNGTGFGEAARSSGMQEMRQRAEALGGTFVIAERSGGGTRIEWRVPADRQ
jgi:PAS domain S-box-containing protein